MITDEQLLALDNLIFQGMGLREARSRREAGQQRDAMSLEQLQTYVHIWEEANFRQETSEGVSTFAGQVEIVKQAIKVVLL